jgi:hypothetical protein
LEGDATVVPLVSSSLSHHVTSIHLRRDDEAQSPVTQTTLGQLRLLPQLTALELQQSCNDDATVLLRKLSLSRVQWPDERLAQLKQLSRLRELDIRLFLGELVTLCQPPHSLQLHLSFIVLT